MIQHLHLGSVLRRVVFGLVLLILAARVAAPYVIERVVNDKLDQLDGYTGHIDDVDLNLWRGAYEVENIVIEKTGGKVPVPFVAPAWAVKGQNLYVGLFPQIVSGAAAQTSAAKDSILDNETFTKARARLGGEQASAIQFLDLPKVGADGYPQVLAIAQVGLGFADMFGVPAPPMVLPPLDKLQPHFTPLIAVARSDDRGLYYQKVVPFPGADYFGPQSHAFMGQNAMMLSILLPSLNRARETANRVKCASNLRQTGQAMLLYAAENKGAFPRTWYEPGTTPTDAAPPFLMVGRGAANPFGGAMGFVGTNNVSAAIFLLLRTQDVAPDVFICPSSNAVRENFGGGSNSAQSRSNFTKLPDNLSYSYANPYPDDAAVANGYRLGATTQLVVRPTRAVHTYTRGGEDPAVVGRSLRVDAVIDCFFIRTGNRLELSVRLLRSQDGSVAWSTRFDQPVADVSAIADTVAAAAATHFGVSATSPESTLGSGQNTRRPIDPARRTSPYQAALTDGMP